MSAQPSGDVHAQSAQGISFPDGLYILPREQDGGAGQWRAGELWPAALGLFLLLLALTLAAGAARL